MTESKQSRVNRRKDTKKQKKQKKSVWKKILLGIFALGLACFLGICVILTYYIATAPDLDAAKLSDPFPSQLYDMNGDVFATLGTEKRTKISYDDLPQTLIDAVTATEDARFFKHHGIDIRRIAGAVKANITNGFGSEGASTITQQVVEHAFLTPDKEIKLKVQEQWLALKLEREYSKEQILEMYLNKIYYGSGAYGAAKAAETYFGKTDLHDLTLAESAILAGLPQRPSGYNPFEHPDLMHKRMNTVLDLMVRHNKITQQEAEEAKKTDIPSILTEKRPESTTPYEAFLQEVHREIDSKLDGTNMYTDGLKIYTTLDPDAQEHVEFLLKDSDSNPINYPDDEMQAGVTVLDTKTGAIQAIGGRRNPKNVGEFNYAIQGKQQAGSTAKPIIAYGPAIEYDKLSTYHQINDDKPYKVGNTEIRNWNRKYAGWMSMRHALSESLNVPAVKTLDETGYDKAKKFAEGVGIKFHNDKITIRDAIGGTETTMNPLQIAGAYQAFGNEGIYNAPHAVTKVEYPDGKTVDLKPEPKAAMSDYTAYMVTDMLKTAVKEGTGKQANIPSLPMAGKTGTTSLANKSGSPDAWFSGYTTNYTIAVWVGGYMDENEKRDVIPEGYTKIPQDIYKSTMTELSKNIDTADFKKPDSVVELSIQPGSNPAKVVSSGGVRELFVKGHMPSTKNVEKPKDEDFPAVSGLSAKYDEDANAIHVSWDHDSDEDASFEVSASIDGGGMSTLTSTGDNEYTISNVKQGANYTIQVVAISKKDASLKSAPRSVSVRTGPEEAEVGSIGGLSARYKEDQNIIDVNWSYDGSGATFEVSVSPNGQTQTVSSKGLEIGGIQPGQTYTITVTPVVNGEKGQSASTSVAVPAKTEPEPEQQQPETPEQQQPETPNIPEQQQPETPEQQQPEENNQQQNNQNQEQQSDISQSSAPNKNQDKNNQQKPTPPRHRQDD